MKLFNNFLLLLTLVLFSTTFILAQNPNCPDASEVLDFGAVTVGDDGAVAAMNAAGLTVGGELLQVTNVYNGGAAQDEDEINDDHLTGCVGLKLGVIGSTDGVNTNMTTTYSLSGPVDNICFRIIDIDRNDEIIINASNGGTVCSFDGADATFTLLDQSGNSCVNYLGANTFTSTCETEPNQNDTTRGAMEICFNKPIDQLELTFYDKGTTTGGSYTLCDFSTCVTALPIELAAFSVTEGDCEADLSWRTITESDFSHFEVQKSTNGMDYTSIATIDSEGTEATGAEYVFRDRQLATNNYYILKMVDNDGLVNFSDMKTITTDCASGVSISDVYPNPVRNTASSIRFTSAISDTNAKIIIMDALSRLVSEQSIEVMEGMNIISLNNASDLNSGTYYLYITGDDWQTSVVKFVKR